MRLLQIVNAAIQPQCQGFNLFVKGNYHFVSISEMQTQPFLAQASGQRDLDPVNECKVYPLAGLAVLAGYSEKVRQGSDVGFRHRPNYITLHQRRAA